MNKQGVTMKTVKREVIEYKINDEWKYRVKQSFKDPNKYDVYWVFGNDLYGSRVMYNTKEQAVNVAQQYLNYRYSNRVLYLDKVA